MFSVLKSINILIGRQVFTRALPGHQTMSWHDIAKCHGCTTIVDASCHKTTGKATASPAGLAQSSEQKSMKQMSEL